jgi:hypothetical protein
VRLAQVTAAGTGRRGAGLGNEAIAWGKSYVAAEALGLRLLAPRWLLNRYDLGRQLGIGRGEMLRAELAARLLPSAELTEELYRSTGRVDFGEAAVAARDGGRLDGSRVLVTSGMWGGYAAIAAARRPLRERLLDVPGARELASSATGDAPVTVGLHVRRGDFGGPGPSAGTFNRPVPTWWFGSVVHALQDQLADASYVVCTDAREGDLPELTELPDVRVVRGHGPAAPVQELAVLAACDLLVCSVSSFSMLAAFLSDRPYLWFGPQLTVVDDCVTIWGREPAQRSADSPTRRALALRSGHVRARGTPVAVSGHVELDASDLVSPDGGWDRRRDLLYYGAVPLGPANAARMTAHEGGDQT